MTNNELFEYELARAERSHFPENNSFADRQQSLGDWMTALAGDKRFENAKAKPCESKAIEDTLSAPTMMKAIAKVNVYEIATAKANYFSPPKEIVAIDTKSASSWFASNSSVGAK